MGPLGFGGPKLWLAFLEPDDKMSAQLTQIEDIPRWADATTCGALLELCAATSSVGTARADLSPCC